LIIIIKSESDELEEAGSGFCDSEALLRSEDRIYQRLLITPKKQWQPK
jgi:hypothetical protein